jgi:hypothetical protein
MRYLTSAEIEAAITDTWGRLKAARTVDNLEAEMVYEAQLDRLLRWWQQANHGVPVAQP